MMCFTEPDDVLQSRPALAPAGVWITLSATVTATVLLGLIPVWCNRSWMQRRQCCGCSGGDCKEPYHHMSFRALHTRGDLTGRILGILAFLLGIGLLCVVFSMAYTLFPRVPARASLALRLLGNPKTDPSLSAIGTQFSGLLYRLALLFIMSIAGSLVAQFGVKLYFSAMKGPTPEVLSTTLRTWHRLRRHREAQSTLDTVNGLSTRNTREIVSPPGLSKYWSNQPRWLFRKPDASGNNGSLRITATRVPTCRRL